MNHLDIARDYLQELLHHRDDIVAAYIAGSVARGEANALSDIDLGVIIAGKVDPALGRGGIDGWRNGIYIDAVLLTQAYLADIDTLLRDPSKSTQVRDAVILYDPTSFLAQQQAAVRAVFLEPQWLQERLNFWQKLVQRAFATLRDGIAAADSLRICSGIGWFIFSCPCLLLTQAGVTISSAWVLTQVTAIAPDMHARLVDLMSHHPFSSADVVALEPLLLEVAPLVGPGYGHFQDFYVVKMLEIARQGEPQTALHSLWLLMAIIGDVCFQSDDAALKIKGADQLQTWLRTMGLETPARLAGKGQLAEALLKNITQLSANCQTVL